MQSHRGHVQYTRVRRAGPEYTKTPTDQYDKDNQIQKWTRDVNRIITKADIQVTNKQMRRCSASLIIQENENDPTS